MKSYTEDSKEIYSLLRTCKEENVRLTKANETNIVKIKKLEMLIEDNIDEIQKVNAKLDVMTKFNDDLATVIGELGKSTEIELVKIKQKIVIATFIVTTVIVAVVEALSSKFIS